VAFLTAATLYMGPAHDLAVGMYHRQPLHANMHPMHATPTLTWCCCCNARATKEWQLTAHAQEQGSTCIKQKLTAVVGRSSSRQAGVTVGGKHGKQHAQLLQASSKLQEIKRQSTGDIVR
jgi:hypothetical protein